MNAEIRDTTVLRSMRPTDISSYLRARGWRLTARNERASTWRAHDDWELLLPLDTGLLDFAERVWEVLDSLSRAEGRPPLEILSDINQVTADVIRVASPNPGTADGSISLTEGTDLVDGAREMMLAAACSAIEPRIAFPGRKPDEAVEFLKRVRLGQTERGSYVITLISRLPPPLEVPLENPMLADPAAAEEPFERKVTSTLFRATRSMKQAARNAITQSDFSEFVQAVYDGVNANLCEAVAQMSGQNNSPLRLAFSWSPTRPLISDVGTVELTQEDVEVVREAGRIFRQTLPKEDFPITGVVVKLARGEKSDAGQVTIFAPVEGKPYSVIVELAGQEYIAAVDAHKEHHLVRCFGTLSREGRSFRLQRPHGFAVIPDIEQAPLLEP